MRTLIVNQYLSSPALIGGYDFSSISTGEAWGTRKINHLCTGSAMRVRRSDNAELDIGFTGSDLDSASLLSFASGGDVFVKTLYGQINGQPLNQTDSAKQPLIVSGGVLKTYGGKPAIEFESSRSTFLDGGDILDPGLIGMFIVSVGKILNSSVYRVAYKTVADGVPDRYNLAMASSVLQSLNNGTLTGGDQQACDYPNPPFWNDHFLISTVTSQANNIFQVSGQGTVRNSQSFNEMSSGNTSFNFYVGTTPDALGNPSSYSDQLMQDLVVGIGEYYADIASIESTLNDYYSIY